MRSFDVTNIGITRTAASASEVKTFQEYQLVFCAAESSIERVTVNALDSMPQTRFSFGKLLTEMPLQTFEECEFIQTQQVRTGLVSE